VSGTVLMTLSINARGAAEAASDGDDAVAQRGLNWRNS